MKLLSFVGILQVLILNFLKFWILKILNFYPWVLKLTCSNIYGKYNCVYKKFYDLNEAK